MGVKMNTIFFDIDTQNDFILEDGALSVSGAESIRPNLKRLTDWARKNNLLIVASMDRHFGLPEFKEAEVELERWGGPFPEHCMNGTDGQKKIQETSLKEPCYIESKRYSENELENILLSKKEIIIEKQSFDVFSNPNTGIILRGVKKAVVYGVATDYCVKAAALGLRSLGVHVLLVTDAIAGVAKDTSANAITAMKSAGVQFLTTDEVIKGNK